MDSPPDSKANSPCVRHGVYCFLKEVVSGKGCIHYIDQSQPSVRILKRLPAIPTSSLIGLPYGGILELRGKEWIRVQRAAPEDLVDAVMREAGIDMTEEMDVEVESDDPEVENIENEEQPNQKRRRLEKPRSLNDDNLAQKMKQEEVRALKDSGVSGIELIKALVTNSKSFSVRSQFSREKYIMRKMKSHLVQVTVYECDPVTIAQAYAEASKLGGLRPNDVYMLMNEANIRANGKFIIFDHSTGYLTMNVLNRLGGRGVCLFLSDKKGVSHHIVDQCNLSDRFREALHMMPMPLLERAVAEEFNLEKFIHQTEWFQDCSHLEKTLEDPSIPLIDRERVEKAIERRKHRRMVRLGLWEDLKHSSFDGFAAVIDPARVEACAPHLLAALLSDLYKLALATIMPGGRFVCYSLQMNPLVDLASYMKARKNTWNNIRFEETFVRKICTQPGRSHPQMEGNLRLFEGYLLSASRMTETEKEPTPLPDDSVEKSVKENSILIEPTTH